MYRFTVLLLLAVLFVGGGCQKPTQKLVEVLIEGDGQFPPELVGTWKADGKSGWEIVFEPNGSIASAVIPLGKTRLVPGEKTIVPMKMEGKSVYKPGQWTVQYSPADNMLFVEIVLENFHIEIGDGYIDGNSRNIVAGVVDMENEQWNTVWTLFRKAIANTPKTPNFDLSTHPEYGESKDIVFHKVTK